MGGDLSEAVIVGKTCEFVELNGVICCDMACPKGATKDGGVKDVTCGIIDGTFNSVAYSEGMGRAIGKRAIF